jgi:hypothetical protein
VPMSPRDRRALIILGAILGAALVAFFLLKPKSGGEATPSPGVSSPTPAPTSSPTSTPRKTASPPGGPLVGGHDPFSPLINASGGGGGPTTGGTTSPPPFTSPPVTGTGTPTSSTSTGPSVSPPGSPGPTPSGGTGTQMGGHRVTLIDIFTQGGTRKAQVSVDGKVFVVTAGDTFDGNFKLVAINGSCATFLFGDQQFILCENPLK